MRAWIHKPKLDLDSTKLQEQDDDIEDKVILTTLINIGHYCQILARQEEIPQKTSKNISRYFCSSFQGHV